MTNLLKKALSVCMAATMLVTASCITVLAEDTQDIAPAADEVKNEAKVNFTIGEPDENGIFTAKLSLHNVTFLGMQFGITFNKDVIVAVNEEGVPANDLDSATTFYPFNFNGSNVTFNTVNDVLSNEKGLIQVASVMIQTQGTQLTVGDEGFVAYEFLFKVIGEGEYGFDLADYPYANYEKEALVSGAEGGVPFQFEFVYPEKMPDKDNNEHNYNFGSDRSENDDTPTPDASKDEQKKARLKDTAVLQINNYTVSVEGVIKWVDKDNKNVVPYIENDRTMVPLRFISETFGADVEWIPETRTIEIVLEDTKITMQLDNRDYQINGEIKAMDTAPVIREDRTFVPIRFVSEALEKAVYWNGNTGVVVVAPLDNPWDDTDSLSQELMTQTLLALKWLGDEAYSHLKN